MKKVSYSADFKNLDAIRAFVGRAAEQAGFSPRDVYAVQLAADEACSNIIEHAYGGRSDGVIEISCEAREGQLTVVIHDQGKGFDMSAVRQPNVSGPLEDREVGGLGVYLIHKLMDEVHFESSGKKGNTLTMIKRKPINP